MKIFSRKMLFMLPLVLGSFLGTDLMAQTSCCTKGKTSETAKACCSSKSSTAATSGCTPSACRGAKTKFGEAKVISNLRLSLIELKASMEKSTQPKFEARTYDIHGIIGNTDDESLAIIAKEVKLIETAFAKKKRYKTTRFTLPEQKAQQVRYLSTRIDQLKQAL